MLLLGIDLGTSSIKASVVDAASRKTIVSVQYPDIEREIIALKPGWAEQSPLQWWKDMKQVILKAHATKKYNPSEIKAIGIAYQMHGLVLTGKNKNSLRNSIIWCDSRAIPFGEKAFKKIGEKKCLTHLLNSPGNFTAAKLAWVKKNEPEVYKQIDKIMLPGDFLALQLTGDSTTSISALSEGVFWDFKKDRLSNDVFNYFGFEESFIPPIKNVFDWHGALLKSVAEDLQLTAGITVSYKAGDQPNNALSLNVFEPGELAATAGTSGVIYAVTDELQYDKQSRVNSFAHVNYLPGRKRIGVLLCINGAGILNRWIKNNIGNLTYEEMNRLSSEIPKGSEGLQVLPFGNGAERMLKNKIMGVQINNLDLNLHTKAHLLRAAQEGIAFAFRYGFDIMKERGLNGKIIRAGKANLFLSNVFTQTFVDSLGIPVELYQCDGSVGAAIGAGIGTGYYKNSKEAFENLKAENRIEPETKYNEAFYERWKKQLDLQLSSLDSE
ncbi:MAG: carbohydrate kinase [Bacteroidetes bacterium]|nr:carbohydrate kinase [Bacteroidota bacterium]MBS1931872.1 carbohydrate kinase [Bacteroidota bacterium]